MPKMREDMSEEQQKLLMEGCAPKLIPVEDQEKEEELMVIPPGEWLWLFGDEEVS